MSRFYLGAMILSDPIVDLIRKELKKLSPGVKFEMEEIREAVAHEVIKREVLEGEKAVEAKKKIGRAQAKASQSVQVKTVLEKPTIAVLNSPPEEERAEA